MTRIADATARSRTFPRRDALAALLGAASAGAACHRDDEEEISAPEDLMREHGVLRRVFTVYDEVSRRSRAGEAFDPSLVTRAARLMRAFGEDYHERAEERWVFPPLRRASLGPLVDALKLQHDRGRAITDVITIIAAQGPAPRSDAAARLASRCDDFTRMYRAHAAREDTVVFPALRATLSRRDLAEVGERMEEAEKSQLGEGGFARAVAEVAAVERALGLDDIARFTAPVG